MKESLHYSRQKSESNSSLYKPTNGQVNSYLHPPTKKLQLEELRNIFIYICIQDESTYTKSDTQKHRKGDYNSSLRYATSMKTLLDTQT